MKHKAKTVSPCLALALCGLVLPLSGCRTEAPKLTQEEKAMFQGGPMPDDVRRQMEEHNRKMSQQPGPAAGPPGAPAAAAAAPK